MNSNRLASAIAALMMPLFAGLAHGQETPSPGEIHIQNMSHRGTGCRPNTVVHNLSDDGLALTILFDDFVIETRRGRIASKNCIIDLDIHVPSGWSFAIFDVGFRGYAALDEGVKVRHNTVYRFGDYLFRDTPDLDLVGPYFDDYEHYAQVPLTARTWSQCSARNETKPMRIRTRMGLVKERRHRDAEGLVTVDSIDGSITQQYKIAWQRCGGERERNAEVPATTCGANLKNRGNRVIAAFAVNNPQAETSYRSPAQARLACMRQRTGNQRCDLVRTGCR